MDPIILMVGRMNESVHDIEVMPDIPAEELAAAIAQAFQWDGTYDIQVNGQMLAPRQTLASANVWDGSHLLMLISNRSLRTAALQRSSIATNNPVQAEGGLPSPAMGLLRSQTATGPAPQPGGPVSGSRALKTPGAPAAAEVVHPIHSPASPVTTWRQTPAPSAPKTESQE